MGSTKTIAKYVYEKLMHDAMVRMFSVEKIERLNIIEEYSNIIIGFPTYNAAPSETMVDFIKSLPTYKTQKYMFAFTACGDNSYNALRKFAELCLTKNIVMVYSQSYQCPNSRGVLKKPSKTKFYRFEEELKEKIEYDVAEVFSIFSQKYYLEEVPGYEFSSIFKAPSRAVGKVLKRKIHLIEELCIGCRTCVKKCPRNCFIYNEGGMPQHIKKNCEHCYRCIHSCPVGALSLKRHRPVRSQLNEKFFTAKEIEMDFYK